MKNLISTLNLNDYHAGGSRRKLFLKTMRESLIKTSFFYLENHEIPEELLKKVKDLYLQFYTLLEGVKMEYNYPESGGQYGFTPFGTEKGDGAKIADTKEFVQVGDLHPFPDVKEIPELRDKTIKLFEAMRKTYQTLLGPLSLILGRTENYLPYKEGNSILRVINYPAQSNPQKDEGETIVDGGNAGGMCAFKHRDINVLTLIPVIQKGLQLWFEDAWVEIPAKENCLLVNAGLMLEHLSNGLIVAGPHQVVCEKDTQRLSLVYFGHLLPQALLSPLPRINGEPNYELYPFKTAHDYLMDVLVKINLIPEPIPIEKTAGGDITVIEDETESDEEF